MRRGPGAAPRKNVCEQGRTRYEGGWDSPRLKNAGLYLAEARELDVRSDPKAIVASSALGKCRFRVRAMRTDEQSALLLNTCTTFCGAMMLGFSSPVAEQPNDGGTIIANDQRACLNGRSDAINRGKFHGPRSGRTNAS